MTHVLLFHHALGRTNGVLAFADQLRARGLTVTVADLFEGQLFDDVDAGVAHAEEVGFHSIISRGIDASAPIDTPIACVGISLGVLPAEQLPHVRGDVEAVVLISGCAPPEMVGGEWPADVPVQVHGMDADDIFVGDGDLDTARELVGSTPGSELFLYPGSGHLFVDATTADFDPAATALVVDRIVSLVEAVS